MIMTTFLSARQSGRHGFAMLLPSIAVSSRSQLLLERRFAFNDSTLVFQCIAAYPYSWFKLRVVLRHSSLESLSLRRKISQDLAALVHALKLCARLAGVLAGNGVEDKLVRDRGAVLGLKSQSLVESCFGLFDASHVQLGHGLGDQRGGGSGGGCLGELFEDVERFLVVLAALWCCVLVQVLLSNAAPELE
jgi:hypothetical protein